MKEVKATTKKGKRRAIGWFVELVLVLMELVAF